MAEQSKNPELPKGSSRAVVQLDGDRYVNIPASEMDRDGDHLIFLHGANLVAAIRMDNFISAYITTESPAKT